MGDLTDIKFYKNSYKHLDFASQYWPRQENNGLKVSEQRNQHMMDILVKLPQKLVKDLSF